jgi:hypothetical protein
VLQHHFTVDGIDNDVSVDNNNEGPCNIQQGTTTYNSNDSQTIGFPDHGSANYRNVLTQYSVIVPLAKQRASLLEGNCSMVKLEQIQENALGLNREKELQNKKSNSEGKCWDNSVIK